MARLISPAASGSLARLFTVRVRPPVKLVIPSSYFFPSLSSKVLKKKVSNKPMA